MIDILVDRTDQTCLVALSRYQNILDAKDSGELDYDSVDPGNTKPTKAAIRVNDLLETITGTIMCCSARKFELTYNTRSIPTLIFFLAKAPLFDRYPDRHLR